MAIRPESASIDAAFLAWSEDVTEHTFSLRDLPQTAIIPAACAWAAVMRKFEPSRLLPKDFTADLLAREFAVDALGKCMGGDPFWRMSPDVTVPISRFTDHSSPYRFQTYAIREGRADDDTVTVREIAIASALGSAAYNSTDGSPNFMLNPFGPHPHAPDNWKILDFEHTIGFVDSLNVID